MSNPTGWLSVCETGGCLEIQIQGDTVVLRETSTPDVEVVTPLASWQAWQDKAREPLLADFKALAAEVERLRAENERWRTGLRTRSIKPPAAVPDGLEYAAALVRAQGTEGGDAHDALLRAASSRLHALHDIASRQQDEVERLKANQQPDDGHWDLEYEAPDGSDGPYWSDVHWFDSIRQRRVWTGPAEPIEKPAQIDSEPSDVRRSTPDPLKP